MAWTAPVDPVGGTVITVTYAVANILDPLRWLRLMTGNADPPATGYVVASTSSAATAWQKVTTDLLADNAATARVVADGAITRFAQLADGVITSPKFQAGAVDSAAIATNAVGPAELANGAVNEFADLVDGVVLGSKLAPGAVTAHLGYAPANRAGDTFGGSVAVNGNLSASGNMTLTGLFTPGGYAGGTVTAGVPSFLGIGVGTSGIAIAGPIVGSGSSSLSVPGAISGGSYGGGSTTTGSPAVRGLNVGVDGIASAGPISIGGQFVYYPGNPPPVSGGAGVPSGLIAFIATGAVPTGWSFYPAANGRVIVGAGSASVGNPQTFVVGNNYGADWAHVHTPNTFTVTGAATFGPSDMTQTSSDTNGLATAGGVTLNTTGHRHGLNGASAAVSGSATGPTSGAIWVPPAHALNAIIKS